MITGFEYPIVKIQLIHLLFQSNRAFTLFIAVWIGCVFVVGIALLGITVHYGRHLHKGRGLSARIGSWMKLCIKYFNYCY